MNEAPKVTAYVAVRDDIGQAIVVWWDCPHEDLAEFWCGTVEGEVYDAETSVANWPEFMAQAADGLYVLTIGGYSPEWNEEGVDEFRIEAVRAVLLRGECGQRADLRAVAQRLRVAALAVQGTFAVPEAIEFRDSFPRGTKWRVSREFMGAMRDLDDVLRRWLAPEVFAMLPPEKETT